MIKSIKFIAALMLFSSIVASCTDSDEDLQLFQEQETFADDTGDQPNPPPPPIPPPGV